MKTLLFAAAACCVAGSAAAAVIPSLSAVTPNATDFTFTYQGTLSGDAGLVAGSKLVIFDFRGYVPGSIASPFASVAATTEFVTTGLLTPPGFTDDPTLDNLVFTYTGAPFNAAGGPFAAVEFNGLSARSVFGGVAAGTFAAQTVKNNPDNIPGGTGTAIFDTGSVTVPLLAGVPEPASWALMILGFGGVGGALRRRRMTATA